MSTVLKVSDLKIGFVQEGAETAAVRGVSFDVGKGETVALVGESGSGKSSLGLALLRLVHSEGHILFDGQSVDSYRQKQMLPLRREMQVVFQDPFASLNPRIRIGDIIAQGPLVQGKSKSEADKRARNYCL